MTLKELNKLNRADKILKACQDAMPAAAHEWTLRFDQRRVDLGPTQSLKVALLSAIEQASAFELRKWAEFALGWSRDEFLSDIRRLVIPLVKAELSNLLLDLKEERGIISPESFCATEAASLIEERAAAAFDTAMFSIANSALFGGHANEYWISEEEAFGAEAEVGPSEVVQAPTPEPEAQNGAERRPVVQGEFTRRDLGRMFRDRRGNQAADKFARLIGHSESTLHRYENGTVPSKKNTEEMARTLEWPELIELAHSVRTKRKVSRKRKVATS